MYGEKPCKKFGGTLPNPGWLDTGNKMQDFQKNYASTWLWRKLHIDSTVNVICRSII